MPASLRTDQEVKLIIELIQSIPVIRDKYKLNPSGYREIAQNVQLRVVLPG